MRHKGGLVAHLKSRFQPVMTRVVADVADWQTLERGRKGEKGEGTMSNKTVEKALAALRAISKPEPSHASEAAPPHPLEASAPCGSLHCAGCYEVEPGRFIHPPKPSEEWLAWLANWQPREKEKVQ